MNSYYLHQQSAHTQNHSQNVHVVGRQVFAGRESLRVVVDGFWLVSGNKNIRETHRLRNPGKEGIAVGRTEPKDRGFLTRSRLRVVEITRDVQEIFSYI